MNDKTKLELKIKPECLDKNNNITQRYPIIKHKTYPMYDYICSYEESCAYQIIIGGNEKYCNLKNNKYQP